MYVRAYFLNQEAVNYPHCLSTGRGGGVSEILTLKEVADWTRVPVDTLRYWRSAGHDGPTSFRLGRRVVYMRDDVESWIESHRLPPSTAA